MEDSSFIHFFHVKYFLFFDVLKKNKNKLLINLSKVVFSLICELDGIDRRFPPLFRGFFH